MFSRFYTGSLMDEAWQAQTDWVNLARNINSILGGVKDVGVCRLTAAAIVRYVDLDDGASLFLVFEVLLTSPPLLPPYCLAPPPLSPLLRPAIRTLTYAGRASKGAIKRMSKFIDHKLWLVVIRA
jgi:hypothetical protein